MKLYTSLPARKDGTLIVRLNNGAVYKFEGEPLACDIEDEGDAAELQDKGTFLTKEDFDAEQRFLKQAAERASRHATRERAAAGEPDDDEDEDLPADAGGMPVESNTAPTGVRRRARRG